MPVDATIADPTVEPNDWKGDVLDPWVLDVSGTIATLEAGRPAFVTGVPTSTNATTDMGLITTQAAAAHAAGGGFVDLLPGETYAFTAPGAYDLGINLGSYTDVTIRGNGAVCKLVAGAPTGSQMFFLNGTRNKIENVRFDLSSISDATAIGGNSYTGPGWIRGCHSYGGGLSFYRPSGAVADLLIEGNYAFGQGIGIYIDNYAGIDRITVRNNWVNGNGGVGDGIDFNCVDLVGSSHQGARDVAIIGNTVWNYATSGNLGLGIALSNVSRFLVAHNLVYDVDLDAFHFEDNANSGVVIANRVYQVGRAGFSVTNGANRIGNCFDIIIEANRCREALLLSGDSAYEVGGSVAQEEIVLRGNLARTNGRSGATCYGYQLWQTGGAIIANAAWNTIGATTAGFRIFDPTDTIIVQNRAGDDQGTKTQDHGLIMAGTATRVRRRDNNWTGNGTASTSGTWAGESYTAGDDFT